MTHVTLILVAVTLEAIVIAYVQLLLHMRKCAQLKVCISNGGHRNFVVRTSRIFFICYIHDSFSYKSKEVFSKFESSCFRKLDFSGKGYCS